MGTLTDSMMRTVRTQRLGYVATVAPDGSPMVSPKGSLTVWDDSHLVFADIESPHTVRNLESNPKTEVNVVDPFTRKGYRFTGIGKVLHAGSKFFEILEKYKSEGSDVRRVRAVVLVQVTHAAPLASPVYATGLTDEEVRRIWEEYHVRSVQKTVTDLIPPCDF
jgi:predicted pyridoxine 5'-phosphate oxidase superfamily flavin-nucleotide-binding protein